MTTYNSAFEGCFPFSDTTAQIALAANTAITYTVPGTNRDKYRCEFSWFYNSSIWVGYNETAVVPLPGAVTTATNSSIEFRPDVRYVKGGDVLSFISDSLVTNAGLSLLKLPG